MVWCGANEHILDAARHAGLELPSLCEQGWDIAWPSGRSRQARPLGRPSLLRNFHTVQMAEASFRQWDRRPDHVLLVAAARYLAAHAPTVRAQGQTFSIAHRLHRGERLYDEE